MRLYAHPYTDPEFALGWEVVSTVGVISTGQATDLLFTLKREIQ